MRSARARAGRGQGISGVIQVIRFAEDPEVFSSQTEIRPASTDPSSVTWIQLSGMSCVQAIWRLPPLSRMCDYVGDPRAWTLDIEAQSGPGVDVVDEALEELSSILLTVVDGVISLAPKDGGTGDRSRS